MRGCFGVRVCLSQSISTSLCRKPTLVELVIVAAFHRVNKMNSEIVSPDQWTAAIVKTLLQGIAATKMFHWATTNYAAHQSSGVLADELFAKMDELVQAMLSKGTKSGLKDYNVTISTNYDGFRDALRQVQMMLRALDDRDMSPFARETQILNLRDDILSSIDTFLYLDKQFG